jgi:hypothetical protein
MEITLNEDEKKKLKLYQIYNELSSETEVIKQLIDLIEIKVTPEKKSELDNNIPADISNIQIEEYYKFKNKPLAQIIKKVLESGGKDEDDLIKKVLYICKKIDKIVSSRDGSITYTSIQRLMRAIIRDIENERDGWWSKYTFESDKDYIKIRPK